MPTRPFLAAAALLLLGAACASSGDRATVTAGGSPAAAPAFADSSTTTTTLAASSTTTAPTPATSVPVPASSTTTAPAPTTTTTRKPAPSTTTTTFPANAIRLTIVNQHPNRVEVNINGASYNLAPGQRLGPVPFVPDPEGHESYSAVVAGTSCGLGDSGIPALEKPPGTSVTMRLTPQGACDPAGPGVPNLDVAFEVA